LPKLSYVKSTGVNSTGVKSTGRTALIAVAAVSAIVMTQALLTRDGAAQVAGPMIVAQNPPPKCGQDPQHPCPKTGPQQGQPPGQPGQPQHQPVQGQQGQPGQPPLQGQQQKPPLGQQQIQQGQQQQQQQHFEEHKLEEHKLPGQPGQPVQQGQGQPQGQPIQQGQPLERKLLPGQPGQPTQQGQGQPQGQPTQQGQQFERKLLPGQQGQPTQQGQGQPQGQPTQQGQQGQPGQGRPAFQGGQQIQQGQQQQQQKGPQGQTKPTFTLVRPPGQPQGQTGPTFANVKELQSQRKEHTEAGGRLVIEEPDHRQIVREGGQAFVRHDENERLLMFGEGRRERRGDGNYMIIVRPDGDQIITVTDDDGRLIRRFRRGPDGREFIIVDNRRPIGVPIFLPLPLPVITIPQDQYIVDTAVAPEPYIYDTLMAPPLVPIERPYSLDEIRYNVALRDRMRRIDVDTINFDFGSWEVSPDQVTRLQLVAQAIQDVLSRNPNEVFLVEGHTDAVGNDVDNLSLSDRRAETVAGILTQTFQVPPENMTTQGYGSHFLKIQTPEANRQNRRVTIRRITPLLNGGQSG
jgi:outer membrane protein OmpA-like peptidoglycan-associated protein